MLANVQVAVAGEMFGGSQKGSSVVSYVDFRLVIAICKCFLTMPVHSSLVMGESMPGDHHFMRNYQAVGLRYLSSLEALFFDC